MLRRALLALPLLTIAALAFAADQGSGIELRIGENQLVTLHSPPTSLTAIVRRLCADAGVELRGYEAADRTVATAYDDLPLRDVLQRLLRDETYMIGVKALPQSKAIAVSWLHVTASTSGGRVSSPVPTPAAQPPGESALPDGVAALGLAAGEIEKALSSENVAERRAATDALAAHLAANPGHLDTFLAREPATAIDELAVYPYAHEALKTLSAREKNPTRRAKLDGIAQGLKLRAGVTKKPTFVELMQTPLPH